MMHRVLAALVLGPLIALACNPDFNHAHHGLKDPLPVSIDIAAQALFLDPTREPLQEVWEELIERDQRELRIPPPPRDPQPPIDWDRIAPQPRPAPLDLGDWIPVPSKPPPAPPPQPLPAAWAELLAQRGAELSEPQRVLIVDRLAAAEAGRALPTAERAAYRNATWALIRAWPAWRDRGLGLPDATAARAHLIAVVQAGGPLAAPARLVLARDAIANRSLDPARARLAHQPVDPALRDLRAYLRALIPVAAHRLGIEPVDEAAARAAIATYLADNPEGAWRADAVGWLAHLDYRRDLVTATSAYQALMMDPELPGGYRLGLDSLRLCYRRLRPELPPVAAADPRFATLWLVHAFHDTGLPGWRPPLDQIERAPAIAAQLRRVADALPPESLRGPVGTQLAQLTMALGDAARAGELAQQVLDVGPDPRARYLALRSRIADGGHDAVYAELAAGLGDPPPDEARDLLLRLGSALEETGQIDRALRCYIWGGSGLDVAIVASGVIPIETLKRLVDGGEVLVSRAPGRFGHPEPGHDFRSELRARLGVRLVRVGRGDEALPYLEESTAKAVRELLALEAAAAAQDAGPGELYALAAFYYHRGRDVLVYDRLWHQWAGGSGALDRPAGRLQRAEMELATGFLRAREIFLGIARDWPGSPEAPKALYSAAACNYWLCQPKKCLGGISLWWERRAKAEGLWARGDELMARLRRNYPDHPLADSVWIREQILGDAE